MEHRPHSTRTPYFLVGKQPTSSEIIREKKLDTESDEYFLRSVTSLAHINKKPDSITTDWICPNDYLIPPFKGTYHNDLLRHGNNVLLKEGQIDVSKLNEVLSLNTICWKYVLDQQKPLVHNKVDKIFDNILKMKTRIFKLSCSSFFEENLNNLEESIINQIKHISDSLHAGIVQDLQNEITFKLEKEKTILSHNLNKQFEGEVKKIEEYYDLLLKNEKNRVTALLNHEMKKRNETIEMLKRQFEAEKLTSTMYILSAQRRKCKIKQLFIQNSHNSEALKELNKLEEQQKILQDLDHKKITDSPLIQEKKLHNVLQLFVKVMSFSQKLLPEQANFFLDFQKLFLMQLNEFEKNIISPKQLLLNDGLNKFEWVQNEEASNLNKFEWVQNEEAVSCDREPFVIEGDLSDPKPEYLKYGSRITLPDDIDLPFVRLNRRFVYAKCNTFEEVKKTMEQCKCLEEYPCTCHDMKYESLPEPDPIFETMPQLYPCSSVAFESEESREVLSPTNINRLEECPMHCDKNWFKHLSFPELRDYVDYDEIKYNRVLTLKHMKLDTETIPWIDIRSIMEYEPYEPTTELCHDVGTQCISPASVSSISIKCPCIEKYMDNWKAKQLAVTKEKIEDIKDLVSKRKESLKYLLHKDSKLLNILLNDESYNFFK